MATTRPSKRQRVIDLLVCTDLTQKEIAAQVGIDETTITRWKRKPEFQEEMEKTQREYLGALARPALRVMRDALNSDNEWIRVQTAKDILDRTGYKPVDKKEIAGSVDVAALANQYQKYLLEDDDEE